MKSVLITGGSGFFGTAFAKYLLSIDRGPVRIVIFSRGEHRQAAMAQEMRSIPFADQRLRFFIGDVRDQDRLRRAMYGIDTVIHAAALKRIEVGHYNPLEVMKTNILGAANIIEAAQDAGVDRVVALSTDKAFQPVSPYGTSKAFAESLFLAANNTTGWKGTQFAVCRYGNIWNSTGSVVPTWNRLMHDHVFQTGKSSRTTIVPITDPDCTRFFMTMEEAVQLVLNTAISASLPYSPVIPTLPAYRLGDLAEAMEVETKITGLPAYEKRHESMAEGNSSENARRMTVEELREALRCTSF